MIEAVRYNSSQSTAPTNVQLKDDVPLIHPDYHLDRHYALVAHHVMIQLSMKAGVKQWEERSEEAASNELYQLHFRDIFQPIDPKGLSKTEYNIVLETHFFIKEKRVAPTKGRMGAGGNEQRGTIPPEDAASRTAALESVMFTVIIDDGEKRNVAIKDIPNVFVQTRIEVETDMTTMRMRGKLAELLIQVVLEIYSKHVTINGKGCDGVKC